METFKNTAVFDCCQKSIKMYGFLSKMGENWQKYFAMFSGLSTTFEIDGKNF